MCFLGGEIQLLRLWKAKNITASFQFLVHSNEVSDRSWEVQSISREVGHEDGLQKLFERLARFRCQMTRPYSKATDSTVILCESRVFLP